MPSRPGGQTRAVSDSTLWVLRDGVAVEIEVTRGDSDGLLTIIGDGDLMEDDQVITDIIEGR